MKPFEEVSDSLYVKWSSLFLGDNMRRFFICRRYIIVRPKKTETMQNLMNPNVYCYSQLSNSEHKLAKENLEKTLLLTDSIITIV